MEEIFKWQEYEKNQTIKLEKTEMVILNLQYFFHLSKF